MQRVIGDAFPLPAEFIIDDYSDIKEDIKTHILVPSGLNFKTKNNFTIFDEMTKEEWLESAFVIEETTDLEMIIEKILEE